MRGEGAAVSAMSEFVRYDVGAAPYEIHRRLIDVAGHDDIQREIGDGGTHIVPRAINDELRIAPRPLFGVV